VTGAANRRMLVLWTRLARASAMALVMMSVAPVSQSVAQDVLNAAQAIPPGSQMLLEADTLIYDQDSNSVTASGAVQIEYGGNKLVADTVTYNRTTQRLTARGNVHIVERDGNNIYTEEIDVTDDFRDGFINGLRIETVDKTYFAAESADRRDGTVTTFNNGVYTACEPCEEQPDKAPIWRVKSRKIIWNSQEKVIRFERSSFELFGLPIASLPYFEIADPTVKRKSGFLFPRFYFDNELGAGLGVPYYFALSPTYDLTLTGTGFTKQGFLAEAEWRQRVNNGEYNFKIAGIQQLDPEAFGVTTEDRGPAGNLNDTRAMIGTKGEFKINPRWTFGWDVLYQTDKNFSRTYNIKGFDASVHRSETYLTGQGDRNYFDLRFMRFEVQESLRDEYRRANGVFGAAGDVIARNPKQPWVLPSFDYSYVSDEAVFGGELSIDVNSRNISRSERDVAYDSGLLPTALDDRAFAVRGVDGFSNRTTVEAEWRRELIAPGGLVVTPMLHLQGEAGALDIDGDSVIAINAMAGHPEIGVAADVRASWFRTMATAGLEARWPVLFSTTSATHVLEPVAQIFARPDETGVARLGLPNEDAQSLVFDAASLFERDKFSGYDRIEGGTRANLGLRYSGSFANGWTSNALFGQSYHLAGLNSYATPDLVNVGAYSGLETNRSDYVAMVGIASPDGFSGTFGGRFDQDTFEAERLQTRVAYTSTPFSVQARYAYIKAQPLYGFPIDRHEVSLSASKRFADTWRVFGSGTYDLRRELLVRNSFGFGYDDECFSFALTYSESRSFIGTTTDVKKDYSIGFQLSFRTIGDFGSTNNPF